MHADYKNPLNRRSNRRSGYAMLLVLTFIVFFLSLLGVGWRRMASALQVASIRSVQTQRDEGCLHALAKAMHLLETGLPPSNPYVCGTTVETSTGLRNYTVTFTLEGENAYSVCARPTLASETPQPMPDDFGPTD